MGYNTDLTRLRALNDAATPGPWHWVDPDTDEPADPMSAANRALSLRTVAEFPTESVGPLPRFVLGWVEQPLAVEANGTWQTPDVALIAAIRNALPVLLDVAEAAREVRRHGEAFLADRAGIDALVALDDALDRLEYGGDLL